MISVEEAIKIILGITPKSNIEELPLAAVAGRVTASDWVTDADIPPFDRVMMDGVALKYEGINSGNVKFKISEIQRAGEEPKILTDENTCIEIMTGAVCPIGADTVIQYEQLTIVNGFCTFDTEKIRQGQNIQWKGRDKNKGEVVLKSGTLIGPAETGVAASIGQHRVKVKSLARVHIISTGDELVEIYTTPKPHQIRRSNVYALSHLLSTFLINAFTSHLGDDISEIKIGLQNALENSDVVIITGGVSKGKFDHVPDVLKELGVEKLFHKIAQKPGKPFWFGTKGDKVVFALPGNPVSSYLCAVRYILPWLRQSIGQDPFKSYTAILQGEFNYNPSLTHFLQVKLEWSDAGELLAIPQPGGGSGDYLNLVNADAFLEIPANSSGFAKDGMLFKTFPYREF